VKVAERRRVALLFGGGLAVLAMIIAVLAFQSIDALIAAVWTGADTVPVNGGAFMMPFLVAIMVGWAVWGFLSIRGQQPRFETLIMRVSVVALPIALVAPIAVGAWADTALPEKGYRRCPDQRPGRFSTTYWGRTAVACLRSDGATRPG
jgi:hypothetical protein